MAFPTRHLLVNLSGRLRGNETWSISYRMTDPHPIGDRAAHEELLEGVATVTKAAWPEAGAGSPAVLDLIKVNEIRPDGKYAQAYTLLEDIPAPGLSPTQSTTFPNQVAVVITLETGATRGLAHRGRLFLPVPIGVIGTDGLITTQIANFLATQWKAYFDAINALPGGPQVVVASNVREGAMRPVTAVSVGRVLDTVRSRRTSLREERSIVALATVP